VRSFDRLIESNFLFIPERTLQNRDICIDDEIYYAIFKVSLIDPILIEALRQNNEKFAYIEKIIGIRLQ